MMFQKYGLENYDAAAIRQTALISEDIKKEVATYYEEKCALF